VRKSLGNLKRRDTTWISEQHSRRAPVVHRRVSSAPNCKQSLGIVIYRGVDSRQNPEYPIGSRARIPNLCHCVVLLGKFSPVSAGVSRGAKFFWV
jgi:hypothetical protein